ncbi:RNA ligase family protein [Aerosakkonema sp. BLCC-F183]|uniref:ATP-dependent DNA ligase n=1 Tax=Aerosakkonema sp. BLCC-F183 TaxID=3342834 RepID=UPI0035B87390
MFNLQLANTYSPTKNYGVNSWWANPKLDGVRGLYIAGQGLISRSQKTKYVGLEHIEFVCQQIAALGYQVIDGELYIPGEKFDIISGIVRDRKDYDINQKHRVQFHVFALYSDSKVWTSTEEMIQAIAQAIPSQTAVVVIPYAQILNNPVAIQAQNQLNKDSGASSEGTVLRHPNIAYSFGRSNNLLKVKNFEKSEFTIKGFVKGSGKYSKSLGKLFVEGTVNGAIVTAKVGTGFTDAERQEFWNKQNTYRDRKAEIIYMGVSSNSSLRLPVFSKLLPEILAPKN